MGDWTMTAIKIVALSVWGAGSALFGGDIFLDASNNANPTVYHNSGAALRIATVSPCTNTGGLFKYTSCSWQNPTTGTQALLNFALDMEKKPVAAMQSTCMTSSDNVNTGSVIFKYQSNPRGSGSYLTGSGVNVPMEDYPLIPPSWYVRCWHNVTPGPGFDAKMSIQTRDFMIR